jgi:hypothetical protein
LTKPVRRPRRGRGQRQARADRQRIPRHSRRHTRMTAISAAWCARRTRQQKSVERSCIITYDVRPMEPRIAGRRARSSSCCRARWRSSAARAWSRTSPTT